MICSKRPKTGHSKVIWYINILILFHNSQICSQNQSSNKTVGNRKFLNKLFLLFNKL